MAMDDIDELGRATRAAFRAYYGKDDPISFTELDPTERQRFEAVAKVFCGQRKQLEDNRAKIVEAMLSATQEGIVAAMESRRSWSSMSDEKLFDLFMRSTSECAERCTEKG